MIALLRIIKDEDNVVFGEKAELNSKIARPLTILSKKRIQGNIRWSSPATDKNNTVSALFVVFLEEIC